MQTHTQTDVSQGSYRRPRPPLAAVLLLVTCFAPAGLAADLFGQGFAPRDADMVPGAVALHGIKGSVLTGEPVTPASPFSVTIALRWLPDAPQPFERELMVNLGDIDIARVPLTEPAPAPGGVSVFELFLHAPRSLPRGSATLAAGFVSPGAPGERMGLLAESMVELARVEVGIAPPVEAGSADVVRGLRREAAALLGRSVLANGSFEQGFRGWQVDQTLFGEFSGWPRILDLRVARDAALVGDSSLRIVFGGGQDPNFYHARQRVNAKPATRYRLTYFCRAEALTSSSAPVFLVQDPEPAGAPFIVVPDSAVALSGTTGWRKVEQEFVTPAGTEALEVRINRSGSGTQGYAPARYGPIGGTVWFDAVSLVELGAE